MQQVLGVVEIVQYQRDEQIYKLLTNRIKVVGT